MMIYSVATYIDMLDCFENIVFKNGLSFLARSKNKHNNNTPIHVVHAGRERMVALKLKKMPADTIIKTMSKTPPMELIIRQIWRNLKSRSSPTLEVIIFFFRGRQVSILRPRKR